MKVGTRFMFLRNAQWLFMWMRLNLLRKAEGDMPSWYLKKDTKALSVGKERSALISFTYFTVLQRSSFAFDIMNLSQSSFVPIPKLLFKSRVM